MSIVPGKLQAKADFIAPFETIGIVKSLAPAVASGQWPCHANNSDGQNINNTGVHSN